MKVAESLGIAISDLPKDICVWYNAARNFLESEGMDISGTDNDATVKLKQAELLAKSAANESNNKESHARH